ncbi:hypothetical protein FEM48_Zijuj01G0257800 [Ziziphus jujuba var. spinosa]|uniref:DUF2415 domain-containing protein n=1 Tax=Ziziphus jujuba var. spinosa TaxID=714518 RepID=A0A978W4T8_ZIZJJ|nr:hypothetical protein FEM48_Zijuj01G0257800 [Ziziphus jujuba var. spinosa]
MFHCDSLITDKRGVDWDNMSLYEGDEMDHVADDNEMAEVDDSMYFRGRVMGDSESDDDDDDEYDHLDNKIIDTSAADARKGKDIQGIPWERLSISRERYRQTRLEQYKNYENVPQSGESSEKLRNLVWSTSKHDVYLMSHFSIIHWSSLRCKKTEVLDVSGHVAPREKHPGSLLEGFTQTQISTLAVRDNLLIAGGFQGELICKYLDRPGVSFCSRTTYDENAITNAHTSLSPDGKLLVIVGDNPDGLLVDSQTGKTIMPLCGHLDFSFASAWHPNGLVFATGNQDKTCRIWDARNLSKSVAVLKGNLGAIRSIRFTSDGQFMAMAEPADFVHIYDAKNGFDREQEIDFFGEISGMSFSPDTESLFIGVWDRTYGSLLQYNRSRNYTYLDSMW